MKRRLLIFLLVAISVVAQKSVQPKTKARQPMLRPAFAKLAVKALIVSSSGAPRSVAQNALADAETEASTPAEELVVLKLHLFDHNRQSSMELITAYLGMCEAGDPAPDKIVECQEKAYPSWVALTAQCVEEWKVALKAGRVDGDPEDHACAFPITGKNAPK